MTLTCSVMIVLLTFSCPTTILMMQKSGVGWWSCAVILCAIFVKGRLWYTHVREKIHKRKMNIDIFDIERNDNLYLRFLYYFEL